jgi:hypothetical protein
VLAQVVKEVKGSTTSEIAVAQEERKEGRQLWKKQRVGCAER